MDGESGVALPTGWAWARLSDVCEVIGGITVDAKRQGADLVEVPYLRVANVQRGWLDLRTMRTIRVPAGRVDHLRLEPGDVLLNEGGDRDKVGRGWVWEGQIDDCVFQNHVFRARPRDRSISPHFLSHYLNEAARPFFLSGAKQTTNLASLSLSKVKEAPIAVPPAAEQARIMAVLTELFSKLDEAESALARTRKQLADYRTSVLHAACIGALTVDWRTANPVSAEDGTALLRRVLQVRRAAWERAELARLSARGKTAHGDAWRARYPEPRAPEADGLPELPDGWAWASVDQLVGEPPRNGVSVKGRNDPPGIPGLRLDALSPGGLRYERRRYIDIPSELADALAVQENDFLVSRANGTLRLLGRACLAGTPPERVVFPDTMIRFRLALPELGPWLSLAWRTGIVRAQFEARAKTSAGIWKVGQDDLLATAVPLPPLAEARAAVAANELADIADEGWPTPEQATSLRQAVLHAAFSGRLVPQRPDEEEPAAKLVARLQAAGARRGRHVRSAPTEPRQGGLPA